MKTWRERKLRGRRGAVIAEISAAADIPDEDKDWLRQKVENFPPSVRNVELQAACESYSKNILVFNMIIGERPADGTTTVSVENFDRFLGWLFLQNLARYTGILLYAISYFPHRAMLRLNNFVRVCPHRIENL